MKRSVACLVAALAAVSVLASPSFAKSPEITRLLDQADLLYEKQERGRIKLLYEFEDGRSHLVFIQPQEPYADVELVEIYAYVMELPGNTVPAALSNRLLEANGSRKLTYFGTEMVDGKLHVFCYHNTPTEGLTSGVLATLLETVAAFADEMEKEQLGASSDEY